MLLPTELEPAHAGESAGLARWVVLGLVVLVALAVIAFASRVRWIGAGDTNGRSYSGSGGSIEVDFDGDGDGDD